VGRAHHNAFQYSLPADQGLFSTLERRQQLKGNQKTQMAQ
jgi:hypothetical protein